MKSLIYLAVIPAVVWAALQYSSVFTGPSRSALSRQTLPELIQTLGEAHERGRELNAHSRALWRCLEGKEKIAGQVFAGRVELLEAAARFRDLQNGVPNYKWNCFRDHNPGDTDEEKLCRCVIGYVAPLAQAGSSDDKAVLDRLQAELKRHLESGTLRLRPARHLDPCPSPVK
jgi:hypothetical protein